jgi:tRNA 2-thiouridine synthesizing protein A
MTQHTLDITGKVCPFCVMLTRKKMAQIASGDTLIVKCDHPPASENIPYDMNKSGNKADVKLLEPGLWEITIVKK